MIFVETQEKKEYIYFLRNFCKNLGEKAAHGTTQDSALDTVEVAEQKHSGEQNSYQKKGDGFVCIDVGKEPKSVQKDTYIRAYMKFMYWTCVSPFDPMKTKDAGAKSTLGEKMLCVLQKVRKYNGIA